MFINERKKKEWGEEDKNPRFEIFICFIVLYTMYYVL